MSTAVMAKSTILKVSISSTLTVIPAITEISGIQADNDLVPLNELAMTTQQMLPGIPTLGTFEFSYNLDPANTVHQYLATSQKSATYTESFEQTYGITAGAQSTNKNTMTGPYFRNKVGKQGRTGLFNVDGAFFVNTNTAS